MSLPVEEWDKSAFCITLGHVLIPGPEMVSKGTYGVLGINWLKPGLLNQ